jgi:uncharacterized membrane protein YdbT with pleckstrin-like domain
VVILPPFGQAAPFIISIFDEKTMGNYVDNNLIRDEAVVYETKYHWKIFFTLAGIFTLFIVPALKRWSDEFVITNKRVIIKTGLFSRKTFEMNLNKIESVNVDQSIFGRLFGFGTITIIGTGGTRESFPDIANAVEFRKSFQEISS